MIRKLIKGSIQRAIQESVAAAIVLLAFGAILAHSEAGSPKYYGCLIILVGTGGIAGVVWSYALSYQLLRSHTPSDVGFWREAFHAQARLLRLVPLWYCAPLCAGGILVVAPTSSFDFMPFLIVSSAFVAVFAGITVLNRIAANRIDEMGTPFRFAIGEAGRTGRLEGGDRRDMIERSKEGTRKLREPNRFASISRDQEHSAENHASTQNLAAIEHAVVHSAHDRRAAAYLNDKMQPSCHRRLDRRILAV